MPWKPSTDFEEEIVNLQPDHDFIFGALSEPEPQPFYPRPQSHLEYAATKKRQLKKQQEEYETTGRFNDRLHVISQVQRIAGTKPLGEQPTVTDWDTDKDAEKEVVAMMRHFGLGPSVEEPLDEKVTIATFPVKKGIEVMQNGRKKVPLFFDDNLFKLQPKAANSSSGCESESNNSQPNDDKMLSSSSPFKQIDRNDTSLNVSSSSCDTNSFHTTGYDLSDSKASSVPLTKYEKAQAHRHTLLLQAERMQQYDKLHEEEVEEEDTNKNEDAFTSQSSSFSLQSSYDQDSFKSALDEYVSFSDDKRRTSEGGSGSLNPYSSEFEPSAFWHRSNAAHNVTTNNNDSSFTSSCDNSYTKPSSLLRRFLKLDAHPDDSTRASCGSLASTSSSSSPILPPSYANMAKKTFNKNWSPSPIATTMTSSSKSSLIHQPPHLHFYTAREVYERNRHALQ